MIGSSVFTSIDFHSLTATRRKARSWQKWRNNNDECRISIPKFELPPTATNLEDSSIQLRLAGLWCAWLPFGNTVVQHDLATAVARFNGFACCSVPFFFNHSRYSVLKNLKKRSVTNAEKGCEGGKLQISHDK
jgi:hypothetical protein